MSFKQEDERTSKDDQEEPGISNTNQDTLGPIGNSL